MDLPRQAQTTLLPGMSNLTLSPHWLGVTHTGLAPRCTGRDCLQWLTPISMSRDIQDPQEFRFPDAISLDRQDSTARFPQPGLTVRIPQPGLHNQGSTARTPQTGFPCQCSTARTPQPVFHRHNSTAFTVRILFASVAADIINYLLIGYCQEPFASCR